MTQEQENVKLKRSTRVMPPRIRNVQVRLTDEEHQRVMEHARREETSAGKIVRDLLRASGIIGE